MRTLRPSRRVAVPLALVAVLGTGVAAYGATSGSAPSYRTALARVADVEQVLELSGTIEPSGRSDLAFGTAGRVAAVRTAVGRKVEQGDVVAVLDRESLRAAVDKATADLAAAKAQLADDRAAQTAAVADATDPEPTGGSDQQPKGATKGSSGPSVLAGLKQQQDAVLTAQSAASTALATSATALTTQQQACADVPDPTPDPTPDATATATDAPAEEASSSPVSAACATALAAVQSAQASTAEAQKTLQTALLALGKTLAAAASASANPSTQTPSTQTPSTQTPSTSGGASRTVTAATLADDQAAIDRARAELTGARADLRAAVVRAPADGTVTSLSVAAGDEVAAGDPVAVVVAPGLTTVTLQVGEDQASRLSAGTDVEVTPAGATDPLAGEISRVAHVPTASSDTSADPTYAVQVTLDERGLALPDGLPATVAVVVGRADDAVTVPASAVSDGTVRVLRKGKAERVPVTTGVVGSTDVEVLDGLDAGTRVVLADLDADVPSGDSEQRGPAGFGGGGGLRITGTGGGMMPAR